MKFAPPVNLDAYYKTDHWRNKSRETIRRVGRCQLNANHAGPFQVHHNSYARLGREDDLDLIVLCENCHLKLVHEQRDVDDLMWDVPA